LLRDPDSHYLKHVRYDDEWIYKVVFNNGFIFYFFSDDPLTTNYDYSFDNFKNMIEADYQLLICSHEYNNSCNPSSCLQDFLYHEHGDYITYELVKKICDYLYNNKHLIEEIIDFK